MNGQKGESLYRKHPLNILAYRLWVKVSKTATPKGMKPIFVLRSFLVCQKWQRDRKGAPLAHGTLHRHLATMRGDHLLHDTQPQAGALRFRRIQRLKNMRGRSAGMPTPVSQTSTWTVAPGRRPRSVSRPP